MLSRRGFLQGLGAAAASLALRPLHGVSTEGDIYRNARIGLAVERPAGWSFSSIADFANLRAQALLLDEFPETLHALKDPTNLPVFLFENSAHRQGHFAPAITLYDEPLRGGTPGDQLKAHANMVGWLGRSYRQCRILEAPVEVSVSGADATRCRWTYRHQLESGESAVLYVQSVLVFRPPQVHTYYLVDRYPDRHTGDPVWDRFIASIAYRS